MTAGLALLSGMHAWADPDTAAASEPPFSPTAGALETTVAYVAQFYPLWFTYYQYRFGTANRLLGPEEITPTYRVVVAINVDTLYASTFLNLTSEPVVLTVPSTPVIFSVLTLDPYGNVFKTGISTTEAGTYVLTGPSFSGPLPGKLTPIAIPYDFSTLIFRADNYSPSGQNQMTEAAAFREGLRLQSLPAYIAEPSGGAPAIVPVRQFAVSFKAIADGLIARRPLLFLKMLQFAVAAPNTPPLSAYAQALSDRFDDLFGIIGGSDPAAFGAGAQKAHKLILDNYLGHLGPTNWITFTNIGDWGRQVVDRAGITEFIQYANSRSTARYYHAFRDRDGSPLDGGDPAGYVLQFSKSRIPQAERFWSITAYLPETIELVPNSAQKYAVARYTPGLHYNGDGSLTVRLAREQPSDVPAANWLPIPPRAFNIMLRVYGPEGSVADNTYVPPGIVKL